MTLRVFVSCAERGEVTATGASSYQYTDPLNQFYSFPKYYYRLEIVDIDGKTSYSDIRSIDLNAENDALKLAPNPGHDIVYVSSKNIQKITVLDASGRIVLTKEVPGLNTTKIDVSGFSSGLYLVNVVDNKGKILTDKLVIK